MTTQVSKGYKGMAMEGMIATWYARITQNDVADRADVIRTIRQNVPDGGSVLEVAPGPGYLSIELAKTGNFKITGLDISQKFVEIAQEKARAAGVSVDFRQGNASAMSLESDQFDFIVCRAAFKNFSDPVGALNEMYRVLKPGGIALIIDLRPDFSPIEVDTYVKTMRLSPVSAFMTKLTFQTTLKKTAHPRQELNAFAAQSRFGKCQIQESSMSYLVWLRK
ncbi:MAG TPA: class I SAM-dependent methyltransferase [Phototrophicaceae bacterium]|nr:class I SAM-dependent methyltransferase [Phototrophicaceae bacterium]